MVSKAVVAALMACALVTSGPARAQQEAAPLEESGTWDEIRGDVVGDGPILDGTGVIALEAPFRAEDAAIVPVRVVQPEGAPALRRLTLVVDENPAPVVGEFIIGPGMGRVDLEMRVRVDAYSNVRAIAEAENGTLYMVGGFVRASGGCSAPASKDAVAALEALGEMRARVFNATAGEARREAQVMLRHPNYSGLQRNQVTQLYVPAWFVDTVEVKQGEELVFSMTGGISISEDPSFRFKYIPNGAEGLSVTATDTDGGVFEQSFPLGS